MLRQESIAPSIDLSSLQSVGSAGSPLSPEMFRWFYTVFPKGVSIGSGSGGTDLVGSSELYLSQMDNECLLTRHTVVGPSPMDPCHAGEIAGPNLGMKVEIWNAEGRNVEASGEEGDLVITRPFLSMPLTFLGEKGHEKYRLAYFDNFPGIWHHGDFIRRSPQTGGYEILGRSDGILNPAGTPFPGSVPLWRMDADTI